MLARVQRFFVPQEMIRYIVAGSIAFVLDASILYSLTEFLGVHYLVSNTAGFAVGLLVTYWFNIKWVFAHRKYEFSLRTEFPVFSAIVITGYLINQGVMWLSVEKLGIDYMLAKVASTFFVLVFNFLSKKFLLFSKPVVPGS